MRVLIGGLGALLLLGGMSYAGYCFDNGRFLSDDEKIRRAVDRVLRFWCHLSAQPESGRSLIRPGLFGA